MELFERELPGYPSHIKAALIFGLRQSLSGSVTGVLSFTKYFALCGAEIL
jgi:hypothetical protein